MPNFRISNCEFWGVTVGADAQEISFANAEIGIGNWSLGLGNTLEDGTK